MDTRDGRIYSDEQVRRMSAETRSHMVQLPHGTHVRVGDKVGRNDDCPCGSGKKFKQCHGGAA